VNKAGFKSRTQKTIREAGDLLAFHSQWTDRLAEQDVHNVFEKTQRDLRTHGFGDLSGKRVLDLGCGQRFAFALQCAASGAVVTAVDLDYVKPEPLAPAFWNITRHNGLKRAFKSIFRRLVFDARYYRALEKHAGRPLRQHASKIDFVLADPSASRYPLPDGSFNLIASNNVLEHVANISDLACETNRLLLKGGYFYAIIHNYYSLSGGHNLDWSYPDEAPSNRVPPWDHLRENRYPSFQFLNRLKHEDYLLAFSSQFEVLLFEGRDIHHDADKLEGERFLTPSLQEELRAYPRDLLLTRAWCLMCMKP
jgi:SAM-dependent methyltransferase